MPESITSEADQPAVIDSMVVPHISSSNNNNSNNHEEPAIHRTGSTGAAVGASNAHSAQQHQHQQMMTSHVYPQHLPNYMPLYQNKPSISGPYNGVMMDGTHEKEIVCIYVPNSMVGAIIGKSGSAIKEMISNSGASIKVAAALPLVETMPKAEPELNSAPVPQDQPDCSADEKVTTEVNSQHESGQEYPNEASTVPKKRHNINSVHSSNPIRKVTIVGTPEAQWSAQYMIYRKVAIESMGNDVSLTTEIQIPSHLAGKVIGKNGVTIKRLQKQTRTVIRLTDCRPQDIPENDQDQHQQQSDSRVQITGDFNSSQLVQRHLRALIKESLYPNKLRSGFFTDFNMPLNTMNQASYLFNNIPLPYMTGPNSQYPISSSIVNSHSNHGGHAIHRNMTGNLHHNHPMVGAQMYQDASNYMSLYPHKPQISCYNGTDGVHEKETVCIYIPNSMVGAIIGKSGSTIKEMISNSGASIKVAAALPLVETTPNPELEVSSSPTPIEQAECDCGEKAKKESYNQPESEQESQPDVSKASKSRNTQRSSSTNIHIRKVTIVGNPDSQWSAQYMIYRKVAMEGMGGDVNLTAEIQVPSHLAGRIIGKNGATIKRLQKQTRTVIRLTDCRQPSPLGNDYKSENMNGIESRDERENGSEKEFKQQQPPVDSCVQITGDFNGSQLAQRQIRNLIKQSVPLKIEVRLFPKS